jgi:heme/copper-type cytochrome/quinol oxidase subunit 3
MAVSSINSSHEAIAIRYESVDETYRETRDMRLLGFVLFLISDVVLFSSFILAYL